MTIKSSPNWLLTSVERSYNAYLALETSDSLDRSLGIKAMAKGLNRSFDAILEANTLDLEMSREMAIPDILIDWLKLTPERLKNTVEILESLAELPDPIQQVFNAPYRLNMAGTYSQLKPLGVVALVYETFPELGAIAAGFCLKTGNSLLLRGCNSSTHSNQVIADILQTALKDTELPTGCLEVISAEQGASIQDLVTQHQYLSLVLPYGRPSLVEQVTQWATAPVLKSAMGNCYLYWSPTVDLEMVRWVILDSHSSEPDPVNAIEKVLISPDQKPSILVRLFNILQEQGFELRGDERLLEEYKDHLKPVKASEWSTPYLDKIIAFKIVDNLSEGITWINQYSSGHADCLVTDSYTESRQFATEIDSALVYINNSPRFDRHPTYGESLFLGVSNQKGHYRGLISLETFTTLKQVVQGQGK
ncbi:glutamate-5-semialdehyde dehydrogenase [Crocosphaera watsonii WH 8501]|uniref:Gamma-glutamyl phosphate reductase n=6 Tax=Crocosphaera watsonii TaxID=263511 RepID=Q4BY57_CROWT|nr:MULTISPECIES: glutamate-5-semialdehyde dehydrogenase [Crocosphaera]EAM48839.1 Glutamate-5-semialdehyde dehydrogenase [Crocosphaera watsonii WH 8501]EHJ12267.1 Gamma-glutamyl phosphate reductase [Crocosphaera watsonii WH 0003]MCH2243804.1 glutamate-5-semialdehyde dehydrogenase [Crocosphaera sp.]NQZ63979.1 glutamate-5-semialdehyde dehydrogenase [Crocosphaera sp.]CCQ52363.1 Gamma-glutamyl phosphate reductase [Crocosphaera watsonii WH 8502]